MRRRAEVRLLKAMHARAESEMRLQALHGERWCGCKLTNEGDAAASFRLRGGCTRRVCDGERACVMAGVSAKHSGSVESGGLPICGDVVAVYQVIGNCFTTTLTQSHVVFASTALIGVAFQRRAAASFLQHGSISIQHFFRRGSDIRAVEFEINHVAILVR